MWLGKNYLEWFGRTEFLRRYKSGLFGVARWGIWWVPLKYLGPKRSKQVRWIKGINLRFLEKSPSKKILATPLGQLESCEARSIEVKFWRNQVNFLLPRRFFRKVFFFERFCALDDSSRDIPSQYITPGLNH